MRPIAVIGVVFAGVAAVLAADPLQQVPSGQAQFRAAVDLVQLDVSVLDRDRRPVRGLTAADFTILENGRPQIVEAFAEIDIPPPVEPASPWMKDVAPDVRRNDDFDDRRLVVIVLDDGAIYRDVWAIQTTTRLARSVIDRLGPTDLAAVVFTRDNRHAQDFTTDRARLLGAVEKFTLGFRGMGNDILYHLYTADTMRRAAEYLVEVQHRRKAIIYIGNGVPCDLGPSCDPQLKDRFEFDVPSRTGGERQRLPARCLRSAGPECHRKYVSAGARARVHAHHRAQHRRPGNRRHQRSASRAP